MMTDKRRFMAVASALAALALMFALAGCGGTTTTNTSNTNTTNTGATSSDTSTPTTDAEESASTAKLEIKDTKVGTGAAVKSGDTVTVNYTGWLYVDGKKTTQFDSSIGKAPFTTQIGVGAVIAGWDQGIVGMKAGGTRTLIIPSDLGYGAQGAPPSIPGNATLYFEVQLISIQ